MSKTAVKYWTPGENREPRRTRFLSSDNMVKKKKEALEAHGHMTALIPKSEYPDEPEHKLRPSIMNRDVINHWAFHITSNGSMICIKNGSQHPLHKLP